jgi:hypothetical protein
MDITLLHARPGRALCKRWLADGTIAGYDRARHFYVKTETVDNTLEALSAVLTRIERQHPICVVRGRFRGHDHAVSLDTLPDLETGEPIRVVEPTKHGHTYLRRGECFEDVPVGWVCFDIDKYKPDGIDPVLDPVGAIDQFIAKHLPAEFQLAGYHWQLSNSAGAPGNENTLKAHLYWALTEPRTDAEINAWAFGSGVAEHVDITLFRRVQVHYTAAPLADEGVTIPVPGRSGLVRGLDGDEVRLVLTQGMLDAAASAQGADEGEPGDFPDPGLKPGWVGAFCRAYPSIDDLLATEWFSGVFERDGGSARRMTWLQGGGTRGGAWVRQGRDGGEKVGNSHATAPAGARLLNFYDLVRLHKFGELDVEARAGMSEVEADMLDAGGVRDLPSEQAMRSWCATLPEVVAEKKQADAADAAAKTAASVEQARAAVGEPPASGKGEQSDAVKARLLESKLRDAMRARAWSLGALEDAEYKLLVDVDVLVKMWRGCFFYPEKGRFYLLNSAGRLIMHVETEWARAMSEAYGKLLDHATVITLVERALPDGNAAARQKAEKALREALWGVLKAYVKDYKQRAQISYKVDPFADVATVTTDNERAMVAFTMPLFTVPPMPAGMTEDDAEAIMAEYRLQVPMIDEIMDAALHARFANDRRQGYCWIQAGATFGKDLLMEGVLGAEGLNIVARLSIKDIEAAGDGSPVGFTVTDLVGKWILYVPEAHTVKRELKELNNEISANPKNQLRFTAEVFLKIFVSAEGIEALTTSNGVEAQFAERFSSYQIDHGVRMDDRPLFKRYGKPNYKVVLRRYASQRLNAGIERMRALGRVGAWMAGDRGLDAWHRSNGIGLRFGRLDDSLDDIAEEIKGLIMQQAQRIDMGFTDITSGSWAKSLPRNLAEKLQTLVNVRTGTRTKSWCGEPWKMVIIRRPTLLVHAWMDANMGPSEKGTMGKKAAVIADMIAGTRLANKPHYYDVAEDGTVTKVQAHQAILDYVPAALGAGIGQTQTRTPEDVT